ncbi:MAG TPA: NifU family protein [Alphaproteobacteria bacterium]|jgi:Fe-S cluster biogenesis protein NfuA|nr:NifU family protein [Alphaproteobacteria bacterium]
MFIQTEDTPNPSVLKFLPGRIVMTEGTADFRDPGATERSPLAKTLFGVDGVAGVFLGSDFVSVTKAPESDWFAVKPAVLAAIMDHFTTGLPVIEAGAAEVTSGEPDSEIVIQIKEILDTRVRPAVAQDGGDITFHDFDDGVVYLHMQGSCSGCPSSTATLKAGIENMLRYYIPEVREVRAVAA